MRARASVYRTPGLPPTMQSPAGPTDTARAGWLSPRRGQQLAAQLDAHPGLLLGQKRVMALGELLIKPVAAIGDMPRSTSGSPARKQESPARDRCKGTVVPARIHRTRWPFEARQRLAGASSPRRPRGLCCCSAASSLASIRTPPLGAMRKSGGEAGDRQLVAAFTARACSPSRPS
jgi:hypothetical protein